MGYRAGGNSSVSIQGCCSSSLTHDSWPLPCTQGKVIGVTPLCQGSSILPMCGTYGMWATSGPSCSAKETPCGAAWHLPGVLTAPSEPTLKVLRSVCWFLFPRHKKGLFPHAQVLLYWVCPDAAVPVELGLFSSQAKALVHLESSPRGCQLLLSS